MRLSRHIFYCSTLTLLIGTLSACAYIIPPSPNEPRNNVVQGEIRKPINNPASSGKRSELGPREMPTVAAPVTPVRQAALPPVDGVTQQRAEAIKNNAPLPENSARRMPVENAQFQISSNGYPPINSVPESPAMRGPDSAQSRLNAAKSELEYDRSGAITATEALAKDAAAEPSMLSELPKVDGVVSANDPIQVTPVGSQVPVVAPQAIPAQIHRLPVNESPRSSIVPAASVVPVANAAPRIEYSKPPIIMASSLPNIPAFAPPAALSGHAPTSAQHVVAAAKVPTGYPAAASTQSFTVDLSPSEPAVIAAQPLPPAVAANTPRVRAGDFDPLAVADNAPIATPVAAAAHPVASSSYASNRYIAPSRYSDLRN